MTHRILIYGFAAALLVLIGYRMGLASGAPRYGDHDHAAEPSYGEAAPSAAKSTASSNDIKAIIETAGKRSRPLPLEQVINRIPIEGTVSMPTPAWRAFAAKPVMTDKPKVAIVIDDVGLSLDSVERLALLPPLTLALLPYADDLPQKAGRLRRAGHELMVHLPMQPKTNSDPGPMALLDGLSEAELESRILWNLTRFQAYIGVNNHMGSKLTEQVAPMVALMMQLKANNLLFLDSLTSPKSIGARSALALRVPFLARDIFLDNEREVAAIQSQLDKAVRIAKKRGYAIAIGHPYPETMVVLERLFAATNRDYAIVPLSQIMAEKIETEPIVTEQAR